MPHLDSLRHVWKFKGYENQLGLIQLDFECH